MVARLQPPVVLVSRATPHSSLPPHPLSLQPPSGCGLLSVAGGLVVESLVGAADRCPGRRWSGGLLPGSGARAAGGAALAAGPGSPARLPQGGGVVSALPPPSFLSPSLSRQVVAEGVPQLLRCVLVACGVVLVPQWGLLVFVAAQVHTHTVTHTQAHATHTQSHTLTHACTHTRTHAGSRHTHSSTSVTCCAPLPLCPLPSLSSPPLPLVPSPGNTS